MRRLAALMSLTILSGPLLSGCALWGMEGGPGGAGVAAPRASASVSAADAVLGHDGVQRIDVHIGDDLRFTPALARARPGVVEFTFHNDGLTPHDVRIEAPGPAAAPITDTGNINGAAAGTVRVVVDRPGSYPYPCLYHVTSGMLGTLVVS
jgi:plastocyanin